MLTAGGYIGDRKSQRTLRPVVRAALVTVACIAGLTTVPSTAAASVTSGALSQLTGEANCVGEQIVASEGNTCGTLVHEGTHNAFEVQVSPDGRNAYSVAITGDLIEYARDPANGDLKVIGCVTAATDNCAPEHVIENVGVIANPSALAVSPDGEDVYVTGTAKHAVVELRRDTGTGVLSLMNGGKACVSEEAGGECEVKEAKGLKEPYGVTVSPDGGNVYVTAVQGEAVAEFSRSTPKPETPGLLAPLANNECVGGPTSGCPVEMTTHMKEPIGLVVSPDGGNVYVAAGASATEGAVFAFKREGDGALQPLPGTEDCISEAVSGCDTSAIALQGSEALAISPNGANVYATSASKNALVELKRNSETGALEQLGGKDACVTTETIVGCTTVKAVGNSRGVAISPDGENVYVGSAGENAVAAFSRGAEGALVALTGGAECVTSSATGCASVKLLGLEEARRVAVSPDGTNLYVAGQKAGAIVELARTATPTLSSVSLAHGIPTGGEAVIVNGSGFSEDLKGVKVSFGGIEATSVTVNSAKEITATDPAGAEGPVVVKVENEAGSSAEVPSDRFDYTNSPVVLGVAPEIGSEAGGAVVTITGTNLTEVTGVRFGASPAAHFTVDSPESITATTPPGTGTVNVTVESAHGTSEVGVSDRFAYVDGTPESASDLFLQGYCESLAYVGVSRERDEIGGPGFAYANWSCVQASGTEVLIANTGPAPSMEDACLKEDPGKTVYAYPTDVNSAFAWGCNSVVPPNKGSGSEGGGGLPPIIHLASELVQPIAAVPPPVLAKTGNVAPVEGTVSVQLPGQKAFVPLSTLTQIPFGSIIEATHGKVSVTAAEPGGKTETGVYFGGRFKLTQERNGTVVATLTGGNFSVCPTARERAHKASAGAFIAASGKHSVRKLWTNAHGKFSTRGNYAAGAVQGTEWLTNDLCEGTLVKVTRDKVAVTNLVNHKHVLVKVGHHYLAKAP